MSQYNFIDGMFLNYLQPLKKWRILDIENLRSELLVTPKYSNFCRVLRRLETQKILKAFRDPITKRKYVYLTKLGEDKIGIDHIQSSVAEETLLHDLKVSEFIKSISNFKGIVDTKLEHELKSQSGRNNKFNVIPDAEVTSSIDGINSRTAFELEISKKSTERILSKLTEYLSSKQYNYILYCFANINLLNSYYQKINNHFKENVSAKVKFLLWDQLDSEKLSTGEITGIFNNNKITLKEIFSG